MSGDCRGINGVSPHHVMSSGNAQAACVIELRIHWLPEVSSSRNEARRRATDLTRNWSNARSWPRRRHYDAGLRPDFRRFSRRRIRRRIEKFDTLYGWRWRGVETTFATMHANHQPAGLRRRSADIVGRYRAARFSATFRLPLLQVAVICPLVGEARSQPAQATID